MIHDTQSAQISQKQDERNIYVIMKTMCPPGYYHNGLVNLKYEIFLELNTKISLQKVLGLLSFEFCPICLNSANVVTEIQLKLRNERALSTGEPCTSEYVTLLQSFYRGTLSIHWYIAQNF